VDADQAARVARRRREQQAREQRDPTRKPFAAGEVRDFEGTCRVCGEPFTYRAPAFRFPSGEVSPMIRPDRVCDRVACIATARREREAAEAAERERERSDFVDHCRLEFVTHVPPMYHRDAAIEPASLRHLIPELQPWTPGLSAYLHGPSGSGKSHQAACCMHRVAGRHSLAWVSTRRLVQDTLDAIGRKQPKPAVVSNPTSVKVLVMNDVFAETATMFAVSLVGDIVDARYEAGLPIVFTSNVAPSQITNTVDTSRRDAARVALELDRIRGRILEMTSPGRGVLVKVEGRDWRHDLATGKVGPTDG
jgi:DNA replication protein DnaC